MKKLLSLLILCSTILYAGEINDRGTYSANYPRIGVVSHTYGTIDNYLRKFHIPYTTIPYKELENKDTYKKYDVIYFPSGIEKEINTSLYILSRSRKIEGVTSVDNEYYRIKEDKLASNIEAYVKSGGKAIFCGYSQKFAQKAFNNFILYNNFPNIGLRGNSIIEPQNKLHKYNKNNISTFFNYEAYWVSSNIKKGHTLAVAKCPTPYGIKKSIIASETKYGKGIFYTIAYTGTADISQFARYFTINIHFENFRLKLQRLIKAWEQTPIDFAEDKNLESDTSNTYMLKTGSELNTVFAIFESGIYRIDIFDCHKKLVFSKNNITNKFVQDFENISNQNIYVRIFPQGGSTGNIYAIATAEGKRIFPYFRKILLSSISLIVLTIVTLYLRLRRYAGR